MIYSTQIHIQGVDIYTLGPGEIFIDFELIGLAETCPEITLAKNSGLAYRDIGA